MYKSTLGCLLLLASSTVLANQAISISWGEAKSRWSFRDVGELTADAFSLGYSRHDVFAWQVTDTINLTWDLDTYLHHWRDPWLQRKLTVVSVIPMLRHPFFQYKDWTLSGGIGIGAAYLSQTHFIDRKMGSHLHFADKMELSVSYQQHTFATDITHYSNANLADINHGVNVVSISYRYSW